MNWINENIDLSDIPHNKILEDQMKEAEELDKAGSYEYFCVASIIDVLAKQMKANGRINQEQWDRICEKYPE